MQATLVTVTVRVAPEVVHGVEQWRAVIVAADGTHLLNCTHMSSGGAVAAVKTWIAKHQQH